MSRLPKLAELEGDLCELVDMADLASVYVSDALSACEATAECNDFAKIGPQELRLIRFCVYQLSGMAMKLKDDFYEKLEAEKLL